MTFTEKTEIAAVIGGTAEALGGGKFANGAVTGAFVEMYNHLHDRITIDKFVKKYFGHVEGLGELFIDRVPEGYTLNENGSFTNSEGRAALAVTMYIDEGLSDVYLSPASMENAFILYKVLGHEMIHVAHHEHFRASHETTYSERAAYTWTQAVHKKLYPKDIKGFNEYSLIINSYRPSEAYNYDKFGFNSNIPRDLWNW